MDNVYDKIANEFSVTRKFTWKWTDNFINSLPFLSFILDIGCGNGRNMTYKNQIMFGCDISFNQLKNTKINNTTKVIQANMTNIPYNNDSFDAIISIASFHHLNNELDRIKCLSEMSRILKSGGKLLLSVWSINQPKKTRRTFNNYGDTIVLWRNIPRYYYLFQINELKNLLNQFFIIENYFWDCGNEIFELKKI